MRRGNGRNALHGAVTVGALFVGSMVHAATIYVDDDSTATTMLGESWATAHPFLQDAIAEAVAGDVIRVAQGTYRPDQSSGSPGGTGFRSASFILEDGVILEGGYAGIGAADPDARDTTSQPSTLTGDLGGAQAYHVVESATGVDALAVIDGFVIRDGLSDASSGDDRFGAGMFIRGGSPTVRDCTLLNNASMFGGAIGLRPSSGTITNPRIEDCTFDGNSAMQQAGAIYVDNTPNPLINRCRFLRNTSTGTAGAVYVRGDATIANSEFIGNEGSQGGAIYAIAGRPLVVNCTIFANNATGTISGAPAGGGVHAASGGPTETGVYRNCIVWNNTNTGVMPSVIADVVEAGGLVDMTFSIVSDGFDGLPTTDPQFVDPVNDDLRLMPSSPAIDYTMGMTNGNGNYNSTNLGSLDLDLNDRIASCNAPDPAIDLGAYEADGLPPEAVNVCIQLTNIGAQALVQLDGSGSLDPSGGTLDYEWFVDGVFVGDDDVLEEYIDYGEHEIRLVVSNSCGSDEMIKTVIFDPAVLSVTDIVWGLVKYHYGKTVLLGEIGLPFGVGYQELDPMVLVGLNVAGQDVLTIPLAPLVLDIGGWHSQRWSFVDPSAVYGINRLHIDWRGARFKVWECGVLLRSRVITSSETVLALRYYTDWIGGPFTLIIDGREIHVDANGEVTTTAADVSIEVDHPGSQVTLTLGFPLLETSAVEFTGAVSRVVDVPAHYDASIGRFLMVTEFDPALFPDGAETTPEEVDLLLFVGGEGYSGNAIVEDDKIKVRPSYWIVH